MVSKSNELPLLDNYSSVLVDLLTEGSFLSDFLQNDLRVFSNMYENTMTLLKKILILKGGFFLFSLPLSIYKTEQTYAEIRLEMNE